MIKKIFHDSYLTINTEIHPYTKISKWNGYLAVVYSPYGAYDFDPKNMAKKYNVHFFVDENGKQIKAKGKEYLINKTISKTRGNDIVIEKSFYCKLSSSKSYWIKTKVNELREDQLYKYTKYLKEELNYIDCSGFNISKKAWITVFKIGDLWKFEKMDEKNANKMYELVNNFIDLPFFSKNIDESKKVMSIFGVFSYYKTKNKLRYVVENKNYKLYYKK